MGILDAAIGQIRNYMSRRRPGKPDKLFLYDGKGCSWPVGGKKNIVLGQDTGIELGNPRQESLSLMLWADEHSHIHDGRITVIGPDLPDSRGKSLPFAKIVMVAVHGFNEENTCDRWQEMDLLRFDIDLAGYMMRAVSQYQREWSRVSSDALEKGFSFSVLGSALMDRMKAKEYIAAGDIYQVNLSQKFSARVDASPFQLYKTVRSLNPAPFASFLDCGDAAVISSSPERFLRISDRRVETRPIKGTRPRGRDRAADERLKAELLASAKDRAELVMIVDLERNDLGRVCEYGSISVPELITLESYATVLHLVSTITGRLKADQDHLDCIRAAFPGGSITGAPKIRAMEIIDELEPDRRGIYTGSMGYLGFNRQTDLNILIRTMLYRNGTVQFQVGGGIVADSDPALEYEETLHKGKALLAALGCANGLPSAAAGG